MTVRPEQPGDADAVRALMCAAFGQAAEADIVDRLRERGHDYLALVAVDGGVVVGQITFSRVTLDPLPSGLRAVGLAPMAVAPARQRQGVGSALVRTGLDACRAAGHDAVFVLGHPAYYPRFGFAPSAAVRDVYGAPAEAFMTLALTPSALDDVAGVAHYDPALAG